MTKLDARKIRAPFGLLLLIGAVASLCVLSCALGCHDEVPQEKVSAQEVIIDPKKDGVLEVDNEEEAINKIDSSEEDEMFTPEATPETYNFDQIAADEPQAEEALRQYLLTKYGLDDSQYSVLRDEPEISHYEIEEKKVASVYPDTSYNGFRIAEVQDSSGSLFTVRYGIGANRSIFPYGGADSREKELITECAVSVLNNILPSSPDLLQVKVNDDMNFNGEALVAGLYDANDPMESLAGDEYWSIEVAYKDGQTEACVAASAVPALENKKCRIILTVYLPDAAEGDRMVPHYWFNPGKGDCAMADEEIEALRAMGWKQMGVDNDF